MKPDQVNLEYLRDISDNDNRMIIEMIDIFNSEVPEYLKSMNEFLNSANYESLGKLAHKAKASSSIMGMRNLTRDLHSLETLSKEYIDPERCRSLVKQIEKQFNSAMKELKEISGTLKT